MSLSPKDGFPYYFELVKDSAVRDLFATFPTSDLLQDIAEERANFRYAPDKWSIKQIVGHITDHERIKMHRAFLLSRKVPVELWGYDQVLLVENARFDELRLKVLLNDYTNVRRSSFSFVASLSEDQMQTKGKAGRYEITMEHFLKSIIGHELHHLNIIKERYLSS